MTDPTDECRPRDRFDEMALCLVPDMTEGELAYWSQFDPPSMVRDGHVQHRAAIAAALRAVERETAERCAELAWYRPATNAEIRTHFNLNEDTDD